jgi:glycosyltransferase involved in cell wall biosynthesis
MKARMLFVSPECPWPASSGGRLRTASMIDYLAPRFDLHCVTFAEPGCSEDAMNKFRPRVAELTVLPLARHAGGVLPRYARNTWRALRLAHPFVDRYSEPAARAQLLALLQQAGEWIWLEHLWLAPYVTHRVRGATVILDVHNVESAFYRGLAHAAGNPVERAGLAIFAKASRRVERQFLPHFDRVLAVSEHERRLLAQDCPAHKVFVAPNAVCVGSLPPNHEGDSRTLYFAGRLDYVPNRQAVLWFAKNVWPLIHKRLPEARCKILGECSEALATTLGRTPNMILEGHVDNIALFIAESSLAVVPVFSGGGTRFKILDAWAAGKAVISTTKGAEGLVARHGDNIWLADDARGFADATVRLLTEPALRATIGRNGHKTVEEHYSLERLQECLDAALVNARSVPAGTGCA